MPLVVSSLMIGSTVAGLSFHGRILKKKGEWWTQI